MRCSESKEKSVRSYQDSWDFKFSRLESLPKLFSATEHRKYITPFLFLFLSCSLLSTLPPSLCSCRSVAFKFASCYTARHPAVPFPPQRRHRRSRSREPGPESYVEPPRLCRNADGAERGVDATYYAAIIPFPRSGANSNFN